MTTNVICRVKQLITSDSRWSCELNDTHIAFIDDACFDKLATRPAVAIVFAGDGQLISEWKRWFEMPALDFLRMPRVHRMEGNKLFALTVTIVKKDSCKVLFTSGWSLDHGEHASFSGSGAPFAKDCYVTNGCGRMAVISAGQSDPFTGGQTKFMELDTGSNNLSIMKSTLQDVIQAINERGFVMDTTNGTVTPIRDWKADTDNALRALANGELTVSAPTGHPTRAWSESEQQEFRKVLEEIAAEELAL